MTTDTFYKFRFPFRCGGFKKFLNKFNTVFTNIFMPIAYKLTPLKVLEKSDGTEPEIIINLTSYGVRIKTVDKCIQSLMRQDCKYPFRVILWLSESEFDGVDKLPKNLSALIPFGLEIYFVPDLRSHKKIYFAAQRYPDTLLVTADDDFWYPTKWLEELVELHNKYPECVACHRAHEMLFDDDKRLKSYEDWDWFSCGVNGPSLSLSPLSGAGLLFPPNSFDEEFFNKEEMLKCALTADDLWMASALLRKGIPLVKVRPFSKSLISIYGSQRLTLYQVNQGDIHEDIIKKLNERFPMDLYSLANRRFMVKKSNKILIVSPCFPPDKQIGALRMGSLCEYLAQKGWDITVMRAFNSESDRIPSIDGVKMVCVDTREIFGNLPGGDHKRARFSQLRAGKVYKNALNELLQKEKFDVMLISMDPFFNLPLCNEAQKYGLPCVLDFRDPGALAEPEIQVLHGADIINNKIYRAILRAEEKRAVKAAVKVVTVVPGWRKLYEDTYHMHAGKTVTIENGYDEKKLENIVFPERVKKDKDDVLTIACFGKFAYHAKKYTPAILKGLSEFDPSGRKVHLLHIGEITEDLEIQLKENPLPEGMYENIPFMDYAEGMKKISEADMLVNVDMRKDAIGTKIYDYVFLNRPILYVGPVESEQYRLIGSFEHGYACSESGEVKAALRDMADNRYMYLQQSDDVSSYGRRAQNDKYEKLLLKVENVNN